MLLLLILVIILYLLLTIQNYKFQLLLCQKKIIKILLKQQNKGFQRSIYWNEYKTKGQDEVANADAFKYISLDPSFQGVNRLFVMAYDNVNANRSTRDGRARYFLPTIDINK